MLDKDRTMRFELETDKSNSPREIMKMVCIALEEKGYNPIDQIIGFLLSGDPAYITSHKKARSLICQYERDELLEEILKDYLEIM